MVKRRPNYGSNIPLAREELLKIALDVESNGDTANADNIRHIVSRLLKRRRGSRSAPAQHARPTRKQVDEVKKLAKTTSLSQQEIAEKVDLNAGRVSEILAGLRDANGSIR